MRCQIRARGARAHARPRVNQRSSFQCHRCSQRKWRFHRTGGGAWPPRIDAGAALPRGRAQLRADSRRRRRRRNLAAGKGIRPGARTTMLRANLNLPVMANESVLLSDRQTDRLIGTGPAPPTTFSHAAPPASWLTVRVATRLRARPASTARPSTSSKSGRPARAGRTSRRCSAVWCG